MAALPLARARSDIPLRPLGIGALLDRAFYFYRAQFVPLLAFAALFLPTTLLPTLVSLGGTGLILVAPDNPAALAANTLSSCGSLVLSLVQVAILPMQLAGVGVALRGFLLEGRTVTMREMWAGVRPNLTRLLGLGVLGMIVSGGLTLTLIVPPVGAAILTLFSLANFLAPFIMLYEGQSPLGALGRGWHLVRGSVWRSLGYLIVLSLLSQLISTLILGLAGALGGGLFLVVDSVVPGLVLVGVATIIATLLYMPLLSSAAGLLYFDLRVRHEGLDMALAAARAAGEPLVLAAAPVSNEPILNGRTGRAVGLLAAAYTAGFLVLLGLVFAMIYLFGNLAAF